MHRALHIVYATDDGYLIPTLVAMASAVKHACNPDALVFHILDTGISGDKWSWFESRAMALEGKGARIVRHVIDMTKYDGFPRWHGSLGLYARLEIPDLLSESDWCIYADGDTLFLNDPMRLMELCDAKFAIQGHADWLIKEDGKSAQERWFAENGFGWREDQYCNSGLLLMNLAWFRAHDAAKKCREFIKDNPGIRFPDQDALAYVCRGKIGLLPDEWGRFSWDAFRTPARGCLHFASDLPSRLMANRYLDYNDAHKLWFDCAREMLGLRMRDVLNPPLRPLVMLRKLVFRCVFKCLSKLVVWKLACCESLREYCIRHYVCAGER